MWLIPGKTKIRLEIFKGVGIADVVLGFFAAVLVALTISSNIPNRFIIAGALIFIAILLLARVDDEPNYLMIVHMLNYFSVPRVFDKGSEKKAEDIENLIAFTGISDGHILYGGSYMGSVLEITPVNFRLFTDIRKRNTIVNGLGSVLRNLNLEYGANIVKIDRPVHFDTYLNKEQEKLEDLRKAFENGEMTEEEFRSRVEIVYERINDLESMNDGSSVVIPFYYLVLFDSDERQLNNAVSGALTSFAANDIQARTLDDREIAVFLKYTNTADVDESELDYLAQEEYAYWAMPDKVQMNVRNVETDRIVNHILRVTDFPQMADNSWLASVMTLPGTKVVVKFTPMDTEKATRNIDHSMFELQAQLEETNTQSKIIDLSSHIESLNDLLVTLKGENEILLNTNIYVTAFDVVETENRRKKAAAKASGKKANKKSNKNVNSAEDNAEEETERIRSILPRVTSMKRNIRRTYAEYSMKVRSSDFQQFKMFVGSQVSGYDPFLKEGRSIPSNSLAASYPWIFATISDKDGNKLGESENVPVFMDFFRRDSERVNSNMIIVGKSGSGKSYATKGILANLAADNAKIYILDPENEYSELAENLHGKFINVGNAQFGRLNPFQIMTALDDDEIGTDTVSGSFATHLQFLEEFFHQIMPECDRDSLEYLNMIIERMYLEKGINAETNLSLLKPENYPTFDDLYDAVLMEFQKSDNQYIRTILRTLINYISKFAAGGRNANIWNGPSTITTEENFTVFNFQSLLSNRNESIANAQMLLVLKYVDNEIIKNRDYNIRYGQKRKIVVVIDEAHVFIDTKFPVALDFMFQLAKRIRKYNGMQIVITQNIKDFVGSPEIARKSSAIINASQYSLIFSLAPNDLGDLCTLYEKAGGINEVEQDTISTAPRGQAFAVLGPLSRTTFQVEMPDQVVQLFSKSGVEGRYFSGKDGRKEWNAFVGDSRMKRMDNILNKLDDAELYEAPEAASAVHFTELSEDEMNALEAEEKRRSEEVAAIAAQQAEAAIREAQDKAAAAEAARQEALAQAAAAQAALQENRQNAAAGGNASLEQALQSLASDNMDLRIKQAVAAALQGQAAAQSYMPAQNVPQNIMQSMPEDDMPEDDMPEDVMPEDNVVEETSPADEESDMDEDVAGFSDWLSGLMGDSSDSETDESDHYDSDESDEEPDDVSDDDSDYDSDEESDNDSDNESYEEPEEDSDEESDDDSDDGGDFDILSLLNSGAEEMEKSSAIEQMELYDEEVTEVSLDDLMKYIRNQRNK